MEIEGKPMIRRIVECFESLLSKTVVVVGKLEKKSLSLPSDIIYAKQSEPKGTLDAFGAFPYLSADDIALVVPSDIPLLTKKGWKILSSSTKKTPKAVVVTWKLPILKAGRDYRK